MANKASRRVEAKQDAQFERQMDMERQGLSLQKKRQKLEARSAEAGMGLAAATTGANFAFGPMGKTSVGSVLGSAKGAMGLGGGAVGGGKPGLLSRINTGQLVGSGLAGFGLSRMVGGSKGKRAGIGAIGGGLLSLLSGGANKTFGGAATKFGLGAITGALGGLF
jgi:hypothetical protein